jgi:radical SAM superfamily enzyme YgiQ (UPF0313 family)
MNKKLDLLLVNPSNRKQCYQDLSVSLQGIEPPIWCALTAGFIRDKGFSVEIIDADAENLDPISTSKKIIEYNPILTNIVVLGTNPSASSTPKMPAVREIVKELKNNAPYIKVILSGLHPSALPERTLIEEGVDFVCCGEGFNTILQLLTLLKSNKNINDYKIDGLWYLKNGKVISNPPAIPIDPDILPLPAYDLLPMNKYRAHNWHCFENIDDRSHYGVIYTSFGCPFNCSFCPIHSFYGHGIRYRRPEKVIEEIDLLVKKYNVKNIKIMDELFILKKERVIRICDYIIERGYKLNIWCYARVDTVDETLLKKMKQAGINWVAYGFESASERVRNNVYKRTSQEKTQYAIKITRNVGIYIMANFIFGLPEDDLETMQQTLDMAKENLFEYVNFYTAMAYPGSKLYEEAVKQGIELPEYWDGYAQLGENALPLPTKYLSAKEVLKFRDNAFIEYFSNPKYLEMINEKFGQKVVEHIKDMLKHKIHRKFVENVTGI